MLRCGNEIVCRIAFDFVSRSEIMQSHRSLRPSSLDLFKCRSPYDGEPQSMFAGIAFLISSAVMSLTCVAIDQRWPKGSSTCP